MNTNICRSPVKRLLCGSIVVAAITAPLIADERQAEQPDQKPAYTAPLPAGTSAPIALTSEAGTTLSLVLAAVSQSDSLIGVELTPVGEVLRSHLGLGEGKGLVVTSVANDSPAAKAGIQKNDVLVTVGSEEIAGPDALRKSLEASADKPIAIGFIRGGKKQSVDVTPKSTAAGTLLRRAIVEVAEPKYWLGLGLAAADDALRSQLALPAAEGLVVTSVEDNSPAAKAGVMVNDVLLKLDSKALTTIEALSEQLQAIADKSVSLELLRRGKPATLTVIAEKHTDSWQTVRLFDNDGVGDLLFAQTAAVTFTGSVAQDALTFTYSQAKPDLVQQISELEAQVKQLEASLAGLRAAIEQANRPAQAGGEKKEGK